MNWSYVWLTCSKAFAVVLAFFMPIVYMIYSIIFLVAVDLITAVMRDWKINHDIKLVDKIKRIQSNKLRKTAIKLFLYIMFMMSTYVVMMTGFGDDFFIMEFVFLSFALVELVSIGENTSIVTGNMVFTRITKKIVKFITDKINKMFE